MIKYNSDFTKTKGTKQTVISINRRISSLAAIYVSFLGNQWKLILKKFSLTDLDETNLEQSTFVRNSHRTFSNPQCQQSGLCIILSPIYDQDVAKKNWPQKRPKNPDFKFRLYNKPLKIQKMYWYWAKSYILTHLLFL